MRCLCCGNEISPNASETELLTLWHRGCSDSFFGGPAPIVGFSNEVIAELVKEKTEAGHTVTGVQKKLSLHLSRLGRSRGRFTAIGHPNGYIVKTQSREYPCLPELEFLSMLMAKRSGIQTAPFGLINDRTGAYVYVTKRIDRIEDQKLAMEDFCQLEGRLCEDKYKGSYERCAAVIKRFSSMRGYDLGEFFYRLLFCYATGNSDMHLKNFSLIQVSLGSSKYRLSPAYDLLPTNLVIPADQEEMALTMGAKKRNLRRGDFLRFAEAIGLEKTIAKRLIARLLSFESDFLEIIDYLSLPGGLSKGFKELITERMSRLKENAAAK